ncbi:MAG: YARHG domain-containing protein [Clostridia bacterium]|nr:YARHG domain-containing protein [Clostridia bacterium]MBR0409341.1 YARHG domain-containing protein [Clostridia bacterium]
MKRIVCCICAACLLTLLLPMGALADHQYLLDSDTRLITQAELWDWDRESLSFMFNEIFARHGYPFDPGGKFYNWFNAQPWYQAVNKVSKEQAVAKATDLEWKNYYTIKAVISQMDASGWPYRKPAGSSLKSWRDFTPPDTSLKLTGFEYVTLAANQKLNVYSAPSASSWRGANGKAMLNTNGAVWAAGWENGWLLVFYETNNGSVRVGYVDGSQIKGRVNLNDQLVFDRSACRLASAATLTDDPLRTMSTITSLRAGDTVTYLTTVNNQSGWSFDYIETTVGGKLARGFIPTGCLDVPYDTLENWDAYSK